MASEGGTDKIVISHQVARFVYERVMVVSQTPYLSGAARSLRVHPAMYGRMVNLRLGDLDGDYLFSPVGQPISLYGVPLVADPSVDEGSVVLRFDAELVLPEE